MPIVSSTGSVLGTLGTYFMEVREPFATERQLAEVLAHTAALAIEHGVALASTDTDFARFRGLTWENPLI